ncbi:MAG TPA: M20/M25/M40 family metallo-hydrolase [Holophagaceae bacterium]|nr:M20/M25/M40 family metallo-hydrolase [Holophagaceae bacterium]
MQLRNALLVPALVLPLLAGAPTRRVSQPDPARMKKDLFFLAGPACEGRGTGEPGQKKAAAFIARRMKENGLKPMKGPGIGGETPYHFAYGLTRATVDPTASGLSLNGTRLKLGEDFMTFIFESHEAEAVLVGYGIKAPELGWDDYQGVDLKGKWAVIFSGQPDLPEGPFKESPNHASASNTAKQKAAKEAGALGLIVLQGSHPKDQDLKKNAAMFQRFLLQPRLQMKEEPMPFPLPRMVPIFAGGMKALGLDGAALQKALDGAGKPAEPKSLGTLKLDWVSKKEAVQTSNVLGIVPGTDPKLKDEVVIISAHHDHLGTHEGKTWPGADDNASGTTGILETARLLAKSKPKRTLLFLSVSGEENGLFGSQAFTENPPLDLKRVVADLNLDMIGRGKPDELHVTPAKIPDAVTTLTADARAIAEKVGLPLSAGAENYWRRSDHFNFVKKGIPALFFFAGMHEDYHQPTDTPDKIDFGKMAKIVKLTRELALTVANAPGRPQPVAKEVYDAWTWVYTSTAPEPRMTH